MKGFLANALGLFLWAAAVTAAVTTSPCATCWTRTTTLPVPCPSPTFNANTCVTPDCIILKTTVIGTKSCAKVVTTGSKCQTACPSGCGTFTETRTATGKCIPTSPTSCFTSTVTKDEPVACPLIICAGTPKGCGPATTTVTRPGPNPWCSPTPTVTSRSTCPPNNCACTTTTKTVDAITA